MAEERAVIKALKDIASELKRIRKVIERGQVIVYTSHERLKEADDFSEKGEKND